MAGSQVLAAPPASTAYSMRGMAGPMYRQRHAEVPCLCRPWASCGFDSSSLESSLTLPSHHQPAIRTSLWRLPIRASALLDSCNNHTHLRRRAVTLPPPRWRASPPESGPPGNHGPQGISRLRPSQLSHLEVRPSALEFPSSLLALCSFFAPAQRPPPRNSRRSPILASSFPFAQGVFRSKEASLPLTLFADPFCAGICLKAVRGIA